MPDWQIESVQLYEPTLSPAAVIDTLYRMHDLRNEDAIQFYSCFISYSAQDISFTRELYERLQNAGIQCWMDEHSILPGDDIRDEIDKGVRAYDKTILCCSTSSLGSYWVNHEIDKALAKEARLWKERGEKTLVLIPVDLDGFVFEWSNSRASILLDRHVENLRQWGEMPQTIDRAVERIERSLRADQAARKRPPKPLL